MKKKDKPKIVIGKNSVVVEWRGMRYEVYFDEVNYSIFIGKPGNGSLIKISPNEFGKLEYWSKW